jgi:hypothetical protein
VNEGSATGGILQQRLIEDRPQAPMPVGSLEHSEIFPAAAARDQQWRSLILASEPGIRLSYRWRTTANPG